MENMLCFPVAGHSNAGNEFEPINVLFEKIVREEQELYNSRVYEMLELKIM